MTLVAAVAVGLWLGAGSAAAAGDRCGRYAQPPREGTLHQLRTSVLCLVNRVRERHGIAPLRYSADLRRSASGHSQSMVRTHTLSHFGPRGSTVLARIARTGYLSHASSYRLAENIGAGTGRRNGSPLAMIRDWVQSPQHRRNLLDRSLRDFGVGVARGDPFADSGDAATYTLDFASRGRR
jgi:uncharacterized protein YkwD